MLSNGVNIVFNGHAHIYERNSPASGKNRQSLVKLRHGRRRCHGPVPREPAVRMTQYAVGWSPHEQQRHEVRHRAGPDLTGSGLPLPEGHDQRRVGDRHPHRLDRVIPSTCRPTPSIRSRIRSSIPRRWLAARAPARRSRSHASSATASYTCKLDAGIRRRMHQPLKTYTGLGNGSHTFTVYATVGGVVDPLPATYTWSVDTIAPTAPGSFAASATSPFSVALSWTAATDNLGVTGYDIIRDGNAPRDHPAGHQLHRYRRRRIHPVRLSDPGPRCRRQPVRARRRAPCDHAESAFARLRGWLRNWATCPPGRP